VNNNGSSGRSALDVSFEDENLKLKHSVPGTVGMIPLKNNTDSKKSSQFYITFAPNAEFDGKSVVFGRVIEGKRVDNSFAVVFAFILISVDNW